MESPEYMKHYDDYKSDYSRNNGQSYQGYNKPPGFPNLGVTCFLNGSLQVLKEIFVEIYETDEERYGRSILLETLYSIYKIQRQICDDLMLEKTEIIAQELKFDYKRMNDPVLFIQAMFEKLNSEFPSFTKEFYFTKEIETSYMPFLIIFESHESIQEEINDFFAISETEPFVHEDFEPRKYILIYFQDKFFTNSKIDLKIKIGHLNYDLDGILYHSGPHCIAVSKRRGNFFLFNDKQVEKIDEETDKKYFTRWTYFFERPYLIVYKISSYDNE